MEMDLNLKLLAEGLKRNNIAAVQKAIKAGVEVNTVFNLGGHMTTPLRFALESANLKLISLLIKSGARIPNAQREVVH
ncbi:MAG TPA: hypothetical protein VGV92_08690 [Gammaproteobacteria bacterium]|nr:hypothetical protein [Gammaproteobacteria bacterium]